MCDSHSLWQIEGWIPRRHGCIWAVVEVYAAVSWQPPALAVLPVCVQSVTHAPRPRLGFCMVALTHAVRLRAAAPAGNMSALALFVWLWCRYSHCISPATCSGSVSCLCAMRDLRCLIEGWWRKSLGCTCSVLGCHNHSGADLPALHLQPSLAALPVGVQPVSRAPISKPGFWVVSVTHAVRLRAGAPEGLAARAGTVCCMLIQTRTALSAPPWNCSGTCFLLCDCAAAVVIRKCTCPVCCHTPSIKTCCQGMGLLCCHCTAAFALVSCPVTVQQHSTVALSCCGNILGVVQANVLCTAAVVQ
jgi:hypothetical protein